VTRTLRRRLGTLAAAVALGLLVSGPVAAEETRAGADASPVRKAYDVVVLRPLDVARLVAGAAFLPIAYPVALVTGGTDFVLDVCILRPVDRAFQRPLGAL